MLKVILVTLLAAVVVLGVVVALQPAAFRITRTVTLDAPPAAVFAQVNDFHNWATWSPWAKRDPAMRQTYGGAPAGAGAVYAWAGNREVGEGRMTILESRPHERIRIQLEFLKPFAATNTAEFAFTPAAGRTTVTWTMSGTRNFVTKAIGLFLDMDKMIGGDFESGLAQMGQAARSVAPSVEVPLR